MIQMMGREISFMIIHLSLENLVMLHQHTKFQLYLIVFLPLLVSVHIQQILTLLQIIRLFQIMMGKNLEMLLTLDQSFLRNQQIQDQLVVLLLLDQINSSLILAPEHLLVMKLVYLVLAKPLLLVQNIIQLELIKSL